ncbi:MAG: DUF4329 domain-containing protein [Hyphomicrobiales bacterium]
MRQHLLAPVLAVLMAGIAAPVLAQTAEELALVKQVFDDLQQRSFARNAEYCGYVGYDRDDNLVASEITPGDLSGCTPDWPEDFEIEPVASFHTHGGYDPDSWSEIPSVDDMLADEEEGVDGWVATPGGRLWFLDTTEMTARQMCGLGCLRQDPAFQPETRIIVDEFYTLEELIELEEST